MEEANRIKKHLPTSEITKVKRYKSKCLTLYLESVFTFSDFGWSYWCEFFKIEKANQKPSDLKTIIKLKSEISVSSTSCHQGSKSCFRQAGKGKLELFLVGWGDLLKKKKNKTNIEMCYRVR